jgi:hydroxyacylglutathione hydrolase
MEAVGFTVGPVQENTWLAHQDGRGLLIDPGEEAERLQREIADRGVKVEAILITHCHFDHVGAVAEMARATGAPGYCPAREVQMHEHIND